MDATETPHNCLVLYWVTFVQFNSIIYRRPQSETVPHPPHSHAIQIINWKQKEKVGNKEHESNDCAGIVS